MIFFGSVGRKINFLRKKIYTTSEINKIHISYVDLYLIFSLNESTVNRCDFEHFWDFLLNREKLRYLNAVFCVLFYGKWSWP